MMKLLFVWYSVVLSLLLLCIVTTIIPYHYDVILLLTTTKYNCWCSAFVMKHSYPYDHHYDDRNYHWGTTTTTTTSSSNIATTTMTTTKRYFMGQPQQRRLLGLHMTNEQQQQQQQQPYSYDTNISNSIHNPRRSLSESIQSMKQTLYDYSQSENVTTTTTTNTINNNSDRWFINMNHTPTQEPNHMALPILKQQYKDSITATTMDIHMTKNNETTTTTINIVPMALVRLGMTWEHSTMNLIQQRNTSRFLPELFIQQHTTTTTANTTTIHEREYHQYHTNSNYQVISSKVSRVPGCISTVHIQTNIGYVTNHPDNQSNRQQHNISNNMIIHSIMGTSDAHMSRGMLACIAIVFQSIPVEEILSLNVEQVQDQLLLRHVLVSSSSRNNGFSNMIHMIQYQIQDCINILNQQQQQQNHNLEYKIPLELNTLKMDTSSLSLPFSSTANTIHDPNQSVEPTTTKRSKKKVALLLSGGVDSSVALNLLVRSSSSSSTSSIPTNNKNWIPNEEYDITAFYLKIWLEDELSHLNECPWEEDYKYCVAVCEQVHIPLETLSLQEEYKNYILSYTIDEARNGRTPNPDILCNRRIKFGCFYNAIADRDFDYIATGHYAQLIRDPTSSDGGLVRLCRAPDPIKDQSYFLCALRQEQLQRVLFPIGHLTKSEVRNLANTFQLPNRHRPDSQGLCFLGKVKFDAFLSSYLSDQPGPIIDAATGTLLGTHRGLWYHTIGQRKGIGKVLHPKATSIGPWYVVGKNTINNTIYCTNQYDEDMFTVARSEFAVESIHWIAGTPPVPSSVVSNNLITLEIDVSMKIRHSPTLVNGTLTIHSQQYIDNKIDNYASIGTTGYIRLHNTKDNGFAPGQYVAFYDMHSTQCFGCAVISERNWNNFDCIPNNVSSNELMTAFVNV